MCKQTCLRAYDCSRASWALNALVQRTAQSIGLHRDGKNFNLSPFDSEMRRRLWGIIHSTDIRAAEDLGISLANSEPSADTALPSNLNDSDISPSMASLPPAKEGFTGMTYTLVRIETAYASQRAIQHIGSVSATAPSKDMRIQILKEHNDRLTDLGRDCNENIPEQRAALNSMQLLIAKNQFLLELPQSIDWHSKGKDNPNVNDDTLLAACKVLEHNLRLLSDEITRGYRWHIRTFFQYHILTYLLWHLCVKPSTPHSERAFKIADSYFGSFHQDANPRSKWAVMLQMRAKALRLRDIGNVSNTNMVETSVEELPIGSAVDDLADLAFGNLPNWGGYTDFPDWGNIVDDLDMDEL